MQIQREIIQGNPCFCLGHLKSMVPIMRINQVAAILYTVREHITTRAGLEDTLSKIADIGFQAIEVNGIEDEVATPSEVASLCEQRGLTITSAHENWDLIVQNPQTAADRVKDLGCPFICYPWPGSVEITDAAAIAGLIDSLARPTEVMAENGLQLCYHNHAVEFMKHEGRILMDRVYEIPGLSVELDTYWTQLGGMNPVQVLEKWSGRVPLLHMKDMGALGNEARFSEIGQGNLDFPSIIPAAEAAGVQWFIIEQDKTWGRDPFEAIADSFAYVRDHLVTEPQT
jgi:sugar phosphate isomerase/epimerase